MTEKAKVLTRTGLTFLFYSRRDMAEFLMSRDRTPRLVAYKDHTVHYLSSDDPTVAGVWGKSADMYFVTVFNKIVEC